MPRLAKEVVMKLEECKSREINLTLVAKQIDFDATYVRAVVRGIYKPSPKFLRALDRVSAEDVKHTGWRKKRLNDS